MPSADFTTTVLVASSNFVTVPFVVFKPSFPDFADFGCGFIDALAGGAGHNLGAFLEAVETVFGSLDGGVARKFQVCSVPSAVFTTTVFVPLSIDFTACHE